MNSVHIFLLDEVDMLGAIGSAKAVGTFGGNKDKLEEKMQAFVDDLKRKAGLTKEQKAIRAANVQKEKRIGAQSLVLALFMANLKHTFPTHHLVVGMSATLSQSKVDKAIDGYAALAGKYNAYNNNPTCAVS
jgi:hypothetical protein